MKDIRDFFGSKPGARKTTESGSLEGKRRRKNDGENSVVELVDSDDEPTPHVESKSKRHKSSLSENGNGELGKVKTKRGSKRKVIEASFPVVNLIDVTSSVEQQAQIGSDSKRQRQDESPDSSLSPLNNNSLFNYFNKVDKIEPIFTPKVLQVKATVHDPPTSNGKKKRSPKYDQIKMKCKNTLESKGRKKKSLTQSDFDIIVCGAIEEQEALNEISKRESEKEETIKMTLRTRSMLCIDFTGENSSQTSSDRVKPKGTPASIFTLNQRIPKPIAQLSEEQKQAKRNFLTSGSSVKKKRIVGVDSSGSCQAPAPLPLVSHVLQRDPMHLIWNLSPVDLKLRQADCTVDVPTWRSLGKLETHPEQLPITDEPQAKFDQKAELKVLKKEANGHPVALWFKDLRMLKESNEGQLWSEKYKPKSTVHLPLVKVSNVDTFQRWLTDLRDSTKRGESERDDSEDEFVVGDDSSSRTVKYRSAALITGPTGIGKTSIVYAVATQLGYEVLELNASANRSGKRILHEFSEALQSHTVEAKKIADSSANKRKKKSSSPSLPKRSLILIEDADLVFADNDDGFLSTAATLAATSKRPVVFVANERSCKQLMSKIGSHLELNLHFSTLRHDRLNCWLRTICIVEKVSMSSVEADQLVAWARCNDIRRCLLQLEFLKAGRRNITTSIGGGVLSSTDLWNRLDKIELSGQLRAENIPLGCVEMLTVVDLLQSSLRTVSRDRSQLCRRRQEAKERDSTVLDHTAELFDSPLTQDLSSHGLAYVSELLPCEGGSTTASANQKHYRRNSLDKMELSLVAPSQLLSRTAVALDFASAIRDIARSEKDRFASQTKRNNRYFHYLRPDDTRAALDMDYDLLVMPFASAVLQPPNNPSTTTT